MRRMIGLLSAAALATTAAAQSNPDPLEACAQKADAAARLACFDQEMRRRHASTPHDAPATAAPSAKAAPRPQPIVTQVRRAVSHPDHRYTLILDNGQVWEQVDGQQGLFIEAHESVTITPGLLGSFFLQTAKQKYVRVRRVQ